MREQQRRLPARPPRGAPSLGPMMRRASGHLGLFASKVKQLCAVSIGGEPGGGLCPAPRRSSSQPRRWSRPLSASPPQTGPKSSGKAKAGKALRCTAGSGAAATAAAAAAAAAARPRACLPSCLVASALWPASLATIPPRTPCIPAAHQASMWAIPHPTGSSPAFMPPAPALHPGGRLAALPTFSSQQCRITPQRGAAVDKWLAAVAC